MKVFKVLGSGCTKCVNTANLIEKIAAEQGVDVEVVKVTDMEAIMDYGVMSTPAVVMDEEVVHSGGIPQADTVQSWINS